MTIYTKDELFGLSVLGVPARQVFCTSRTKQEVSSKAGYFESIGIEVEVVLSGSDAFYVLSSLLAQDVATFVFTDQKTVLGATPDLNKLKNFAAVVSVELEVSGYCLIPSLKDYFPVILISSNAEDFQRSVFKATELACTLRQPILHLYDAEGISEINSTIVDSFHCEINEVPLDTQESIASEYNVVTSESNRVLVVNLSPYGKQFLEILPNGVAFYDVTTYSPFDFVRLLEATPSSVERIVVVQGSDNKPFQVIYEPILVDLFADFNTLVEKAIDNVIVTNVGRLENISATFESIISNALSSDPCKTLYLSDVEKKREDEVSSRLIDNVLFLEEAYTLVLEQIFGKNLQILNQFGGKSDKSSNLEHGFGKYLRQQENRQRLISISSNLLDPTLFEYEGINLVTLLSRWISYNKEVATQTMLNEANSLAEELYQLLLKNSHSDAAKSILDFGPDVEHFKFNSTWLIGSDAWAADIGNSGVHHLLSSCVNLNVLIVDSDPMKDSKRIGVRKKDIGLYAMNFRNAYVASVAAYSNYSQMWNAIIEASKFKGPSIILAYLPYHSENDTPLEVLKETKRAVQSGYWPLYRYDPTEASDSDVFKLDSTVIRKQLKDFLDRENRLSILSRKSPEFSSYLKMSATDVINSNRERKAKAAVDEMLRGLSGPPLSIYYASDGGTASDLAKFLCSKAVARGVKATVFSMDAIVLEELPTEGNVVFITSTAGQGEFPQDGKAFWEALKSSVDLDLSSISYSVFGLGDSLYWPRKEDKHYYNKPAVDLFKKLQQLGAKSFVPLGLGDSQDADGYKTAYAIWEPQLWESLGVSNECSVDDDFKPRTNEDIKIESNYLRGTIAKSLLDDSTGGVPHDDDVLMKFHGIYTQDDRDIRDIRRSQELEPYYIFMARIRLPGGIATPEQYLMLDHLADKTGNGTVKLTTRATFQLHGIIKRNLKHSIRGLNSTLLDTLGASGDVNRNVMVTALPYNNKVHKQVSRVASEISEYLLPNSTAYHEIWLEGPDDMDEDPNWVAAWEGAKGGPKKKMLVGGNALQDFEPLYGPTYLPRKFKVNITVPPYNDVDVWAVDVGLIAIIDDSDNLVGFNVLVGGGMGTTHNNNKTYPRAGSPFGFVTVEDVCTVIEKIVIVQRDYGDRTDRKHARLKYTIDDLGVDVYKEKVEELWGKKFAPERPYTITSNIDYFGWVKDELGLNHFTAFIENGRVEDTPSLPQKTGLRKIASYMRDTRSGNFRLTGNQHIIISEIEDKHLEAIQGLLNKYKLSNYDFTGLRLSSSACVALPTCGFAMAESERYLPSLITKLEDTIEQYGLRHDSVIMRMSGCPNGCSRPWLAEVACVGKAPGVYNLLLGGGYYGQRLNKLYRASIMEDEILAIMKPLFKKWSLERQQDEHFGDFLIRAGVIKPTLEGKYFHEDLPEEATEITL
ncbi:HEL318Cp [Eremothecium sinecaudum]|uniref:assimilatory sulfite reductase (NADPH) n=1 Tax=Eremothecium sinecaudum TaxID=45286 RepID=A0A0X8HT72_9SACH|nr:HEL318Cp [Eremothecium sinecaudum]AMD20963.1 HEL318Cp [Eremothecium sinecaudum]